MDDEFILVSKNELDKLKQNTSTSQETKTKENDKTKVEKPEISTDILKEFRKIIQEENKIEKEQLIQDLTHIKDLNKTTLSSVLERTDKLDTRIETLVEAISDLVKTVHELVEENTKENPHEEIISEIKKLKENDKTAADNIIITQKLEEIDEFMNNLKLLLSQIKPSQMSM